MRPQVHRSEAESLRRHRVARPGRRSAVGGIAPTIRDRPGLDPARSGPSDMPPIRRCWRRRPSRSISKKPPAVRRGPHSREASEFHRYELRRGAACRGFCEMRWTPDLTAWLSPSRACSHAAERTPRSGRKAHPRGLPTGGHSHSDRMHVSDRFGLREKAKQIREDLSPVANDERRVSKL